MKNGKEAIVGSMDLEVLCWITEKYGTLEEFQQKFTTLDFKNFPEISELLFQMLENQRDFEDIRDFRKNFPFASIGHLSEAIEKCIYASFPSESIAEESSAEGNL